MRGQEAAQRHAEESAKKAEKLRLFNEDLQSRGVNPANEVKVAVRADGAEPRYLLSLAISTELPV